MKTNPLRTLFFAMAISLYAIPAHATTWYTSANLDFTSIQTVAHNSKYISSVAYFAVIGTVGGVSTGIQGIYANQDQVVMQRCLALAEEFNLSRRTTNSLLFRIQVQTDPANPSFSQIQYCELHQ